jgi:hypothetical protein
VPDFVRLPAFGIFPPLVHFGLRFGEGDGETGNGKN